jgi:hypothetical protein
MAREPEPPEGVPKYVREGVDRQDADSLRKLIEYCEARLAYLEAQAARPLDEDDLADDGEEIVDVEEGGGGTKVVKKVPCGKDNCSSCPHGPYEYRVHREGDSVKWEYEGAVQ